MRLQHERAGDDDPLPLPTGQLVRVVQEEALRRSHPGAREGLRHLCALVPVNAVDPQALGHGLVDRLARVEGSGGILEHHLDLPPVGPEPLPDRLAFIEDLAPLRTLEAHHGSRRRRLAAPRFAGQRQDLSLLELQADTVDRSCERGLPADESRPEAEPAGERDVDVPDLEDRTRPGLGALPRGRLGLHHASSSPEASRRAASGAAAVTPAAASAPSTSRHAARRPWETS